MKRRTKIALILATFAILAAIGAYLQRPTHPRYDVTLQRLESVLPRK